MKLIRYDLRRHRLSRAGRPGKQHRQSPAVSRLFRESPLRIDLMAVLHVGQRAFQQLYLGLREHKILPGISGLYRRGERIQPYHHLSVAAFVQQLRSYSSSGKLPGTVRRRGYLSRGKPELRRHLRRVDAFGKLQTGQRVPPQCEPLILVGIRNLQR